MPDCAQRHTCPWKCSRVAKKLEVVSMQQKELHICTEQRGKETLPQQFGEQEIFRPGGFSSSPGRCKCSVFAAIKVEERITVIICKTL